MTDCAARAHGNRYAYQILGCRCPAAVEAARRNWRRRRVPGTKLRAPKSRDPHIDPIAVEKACKGLDVALTVLERRECVRRLTAKGMTARQIAELLAVSERTVNRHRAAA